MRSKHSFPLVQGLVLVLLALGCGGPAQAGPEERLTLTLVAPTAISDDTVAAPVSGGIIVRVTNAAGRPESGVSVVFSSQAIEPDRSGDPNWVWPFICFAPWGEMGCVAKTITMQTDADGRASAPVIRGNMTGTLELLAAIKGQSPAVRLGARILPGHAYVLDVQPHDTAVFVGGSYRLRVIATDNSGNRVQSPPRYRVVPAIAAVDTAGILTGLATGRARIEVLLDDTTIVRRVSVVPGLTLAGNVNQDLVEFGADGGSFRTLVAGMGEVSGLTWSPDASELLFTTPNGFTGVMRAVNRMTKQLRVVGGWFPWDPIWPQYAARDGRIYFMAIPTLVGYGGYGIWRVNPDGTGFEQLTAPTVAGHGDWHPSVSPDGNTVVFALERGAGLSGAQLAFLDLGQGTVRTTATLGFLPRWSPDGRTIAYLNNGEVKLADPSGNELRTLTPLGSYGGELVWSRDGRWLVTVGDSGTTIIDAQNGTAMPLDFARFRAVPR